MLAVSPRDVKGMCGSKPVTWVVEQITAAAEFLGIYPSYLGFRKGAKA